MDGAANAPGRPRLRRSHSYLNTWLSWRFSQVPGWQRKRPSERTMAGRAVFSGSRMGSSPGRGLGGREPDDTGGWASGGGVAGGGGRLVSTVKLRPAGVASSLPEESVAVTAKV